MKNALMIGNRLFLNVKLWGGFFFFLKDIGRKEPNRIHDIRIADVWKFMWQEK